MRVEGLGFGLRLRVVLSFEAPRIRTIDFFGEAFCSRGHALFLLWWKRLEELGARSISRYLAARSKA